MRNLLIFLSLLPSSLLAQVATVVESITEFEYTGSHSAVCREHRVIRINNEHGTEFSIFRCYCDKSLSLSKFSGTITDANDKVLWKVKRGDLIRSEYSTEFSSDDYGYFYGYESHNFPYTVTYDWETKYDDEVLSIPSFVPIPGYEVNVESAFYRVICTNKNECRYKAFNFDQELKETTDEKGRKVLELSVKGLPLIPKYSFGLPFDKQAPRVYAIPKGFEMGGTRCDLSTWQSFGEWIEGLRKGRDQIPQALADRLKAMTDTCQSDRSRVEVVRRFMGETTRYISIQNGLSGYRTMSVEQVFKKGIGDCKALTNYFCSMLRHLGIPANYAHISTHYKRLMEYPNMQQLNHIIAQVPLQDDTLWVECTNANYPYYHMPVDYADHDVVVMTDDGAKLMRIPDQPDTMHTEQNVYHMTLSSNGNAAIQLDRRLQGRLYDTYLGLLTLGTSEQRKHMLQNIGLPKTTLGELNMKHQDNVFCLNAQFQTESYAKRTGNRLFVPICPETFSGLRNTNEPPHAISLEDAGLVEQDTIYLTLPEGATIEHLPEPVIAESVFGTFSVSAVQNVEGKVEVHTQLLIHSGEYPESQYNEWVAWRKKITTLSSAKMVIVCQ